MKKLLTAMFVALLMVGFLAADLTGKDFKATMKLAMQGNAAAQNNLGYMYNYGEGVPEDYKEAVKWYRKAAAQGNAAAQVNLGAMYYEGSGVPKNNIEAIKWFLKAAEQGSVNAQQNLGWMYASGSGVRKNYAYAYAWYSVARASGDEAAKKKADILRAEMTKEQIANAQVLSKKIWERIEAAKRRRP